VVHIIQQWGVVMKKTTILVLFSTLFSVGVYAAQNGFEVMSFRPATDNGNYLGMWDSNILDKGEWFFGTTFDYSYRPLQTTVRGVRDSGILDKIFEEHLYSSVGLIKDRLEVGIDIPIGWWIDYKNQNKTALGDLLLNAKVSLLNMKKSGIGLSVLPFLSLPNGKSDYFFGNGVMTAGGSLIAEVNPIDRVFVAMNLGLLAKKSYVLRDMNDTSKLTGGLGVAVAATNNLNISADLLFKTRLSGVFREQEETPVELLTGVKYAIANTGFVVNGAIGGGLINGGGAPQYRIIFGLGYDLKPCKGVMTNATNTEPETSTKTETATKSLDQATANESSAYIVHFAFNSTKIEKSEEKAKLNDLAKMLRKDPTKKITIESYTDDKGSKSVNARVSRKRARAVERYLNRRGVSKYRMTMTPYGSENPVADNNTEEGRQANRRGAIIMVQEISK